MQSTELLSEQPEHGVTSVLVYLYCALRQLKDSSEVDCTSGSNTRGLSSALQQNSSNHIGAKAHQTLVHPEG